MKLDRSTVLALDAETTDMAFSDKNLEKEFWERAFLQTKNVWRGLSLIMMLSVILIIITYWVLSDRPKDFVAISMGTIFLSCGFSVLAMRYGWFEASRHMVPSIVTLVAQSAALSIVVLSDRSLMLSPIAFICIVVGGIIFIRKPARLVLILFPTAVYLAHLIFSSTLSFDRFFLYQIGFTIVVASLAIMSSSSREHAERTEFIASREKAAALKKADELLANILPESVAEKVKAQEITEVRLVEQYESVTVLFVDLVGFTRYAAVNPPDVTIDLLNNIFRRFDAIVDQCGVEKIKTMGDAYLAVSGLPVRTQDHAIRIANAALEMREAMVKFRYLLGIDLELRIGIHSGPVIAGILGTKKFMYDIWGDTVNTASRLESHGVPGAIQVSKATKDLLGDGYNFRDRGSVSIKDKGDMEVFILESPCLTTKAKESFAA